MLISVLLVGVAGVLTSATAAISQDVPQVDRTDALRVFIDCRQECDEQYIRNEITIVNYVRDPTDAEVHVLITTQPTGGGGTEYSVQFIGTNRFTGAGQTLKYAAPQLSTADERRGAIVQILKRGLVRYIAETPLADRLQIAFAPATVGSPANHVRDRWNFWAFRTTLGGSLSGEQSNVSRSVRGTASANRTTEAWKVTFSTSVNYREDTFELDETTSFRSVTKGMNSSVIVVKSLTDRWSAGIVANAAASTFLNYDLRVRVAPGVEYNIFPYSEATRRLLTIQYTLGAASFDYVEETIFGRLSERLLDHRVGALFSMLQPWGSASAELTFSQFLNRRANYNVTAFGQTDVRLFKGFSFNTFATISRTRDQIYLPRAGATLEEILVRQRQLATSYQYSVNFGIAYSFGSIFNNVVNPRFGGGGGDPLIF